MRSLGLITKEAVVAPLAGDMLYGERLGSRFSAALPSLPPPESDPPLLAPSSKGLRGIRRFTSENCMESLQAEVREKAS